MIVALQIWMVQPLMVIMWMMVLLMIMVLLLKVLLQMMMLHDDNDNVDYGGTDYGDYGNTVDDGAIFLCWCFRLVCC